MPPSLPISNQGKITDVEKQNLPASVFTPRVICPPNLRTFNSDGTRVSEVGLKEWVEGDKKEGEGGEGVGMKRYAQEEASLMSLFH